ncbi:MAG TPA: ergothioneine biosynthesis protein EgtC [Frankiaceae bacterium]|nr:ergothioneine biosynthesis protein EgtC [Frankiaceae bacterium]
MCRHLAWLGPPRTLASLLLEPPHGLLRQSYAPRRQRYGLVNADGFGAGWYAPEVRPEPARYRRAVPLWTDASFASLAGVVRSGCVLAAVRSASVGTPVEESATAPFQHGRVLLSHNGRVSPAALRPLLDPAAPPESGCDSALLAALLWQRLDAATSAEDASARAAPASGGGPVAPTSAAGPAGALAAALGAVVLAAAGRDPAARLNLLAADGRTLAATVWGDTLSVRRGPAGGLLLASEPTDDGPGWTDLPDRCVVGASPHGLAVTRLVPTAQRPEDR